MKTLSILLLQLLLSCLVQSQPLYNDYLPSEKLNLFFDDFNDNSAKHYTGVNENISASIQNGKYELQNKSNMQWLKFITHSKNITYKAPVAELDQSRDFEIETAVRIIEFAENHDIFGIIYGCDWVNFKSIENYYRFAYTPNQLFASQSINGSKWKNFKEWTKSFSLKSGEFNKLTVRKIGNQVHLFINEVYMLSQAFEPFYGHYHGVTFGRKSKIELDYFRISYLNPDQNSPVLAITNPDLSRGFVVPGKENRIEIKGFASDESGISSILINGERIQTDGSGNFSKWVNLVEGDNRFTVKALDSRNNAVSMDFTIQRETNVPVTNQSSFGKYYALIIGNNVYQDPSVASLEEPISDATKLYNALITRYVFEPANVTFIKNATYVQMIEAFDKLSSLITPEDNLLVFYAGHGWWDENKKLGYWLPVDSKSGSTAFWIPNSRISDYMSSIHSKHTLLIADACFSGSIFKTRSAFADAQPAINKLYELPSRKAMTSGNMKEVPDKSAFLYYLVKRLNENTEKYISSDMLFASFRQAVMNNSPTEPQYGTIQNSGDEGGEFIFILK